MTSHSFDVAVIGSGPGGEGAAMKAAKSGLKVAMIEKDPVIGGSCTHRGTIPSKTLRQSMHNLIEFKRNEFFRGMIENSRIDYPALLANARNVISAQVRMREDFYNRNNVELFHGHARFIQKDTIMVEPGHIEIKAKNFIIATGSRPYHPPGLDFAHSLIRDSDSILQMPFTPSSITIYGAGVIGCEYASIFKNMGIKVNLVNTRDRLLSFLDDEITDALSYHLREQGVVIRHQEQFAGVDIDDEVTLSLESGKKIKSHILLWANGRTGNSDNMGLEDIGVETDSRGFIETDENYKTTVDGIFAAGDVAGPPGLASASYDQGRYAASVIASESVNFSADDVPSGIYTSPEISSLGATERELTENKVPYEVGHSFFKSLARAQITGYTVGMLKILFHRETLEILGIHCFGYQAAEIVHIGQAIMKQPGSANSIRYFVETTFNYPTMAEAYRVAALNGLNRL